MQLFLLVYQLNNLVNKLMDDNCVTIYDIKSQHFGVVLASQLLLK